MIVGVLPSTCEESEIHWGVSPNSIPAFMEALDTFYKKNRLHKDIAFHVYYAFEWIQSL